MTTGRINQVTICSPGASLAARPRIARPEGQDSWLEGAPVRNARPQADTPLRLARGRDSRGHPFAPTEFPRPPSTAGTLGR